LLVRWWGSSEPTTVPLDRQSSPLAEDAAQGRHCDIKFIDRRATRVVLTPIAEHEFMRDLGGAPSHSRRRLAPGPAKSRGGGRSSVGCPTDEGDLERPQDL
jgi:hypothetical protein